MPDTILIRLKPYDRKRGFVLRRYSFMGMRFREDQGWYEVEQEVAALVKEIKQPPVGDTPPELAPLAFDIMTADAAVVMEEEQRKAKEERAKAVSPHRMAAPEGVLTTDDLPKPDRVAESVEVPPDRPSKPRTKRRKGTR